MLPQRGGGGVGRDAALDSVAGEAPPGAGREQRIVWPPCSFVEPEGFSDSWHRTLVYFGLAEDRET